MSLVETKTVRGGILDVLRFAAALFVVLFHYGDEAPTPLASIHSAFDHGYLATDFFILLSGYVLGRAYGWAIEAGRTGPAEFLARRVSRIWPAHAIVLFLMILVVGAASLAGIQSSHGWYNASDLLPQLFLVQAWADVGGGGWNLPTWSLSALVFCYAVFPLLWRTIISAPLWAVAAASALIVAIFDTLSWALLSNGLFDLPFYIGAFRALPMFVVGVVVARWTMEAPVPARLAGPLAAVAGVALIGLQLVGTFNALSFALIAASVLCIGSLPIRRPIPFAEAAGKLSFALFITHALAASVWFGLEHAVASEWSEPARWALWVGSFGFALTAAWMFDRIIDQPIQKRIAPLLARVFTSRPGQYPGQAQSA